MQGELNVFLDFRDLVTKVQVDIPVLHDTLGNQWGTLGFDPCKVHHINQLAILKNRVHEALVRELGITISENYLFHLWDPQRL